MSHRNGTCVFFLPERHKYFTKRISTHLLTVLTMRAILRIEQKRKKHEHRDKIKQEECVMLMPSILEKIYLMIL